MSKPLLQIRLNKWTSIYTIREFLSHLKHRSHLTGGFGDRMLAPYMVDLSSNTWRPKISTYVVTALSLFTRHLHMQFEGSFKRELKTDVPCHCRSRMVKILQIWHYTYSWWRLDISEIILTVEYNPNLIHLIILPLGSLIFYSSMNCQTIGILI